MNGIPVGHAAVAVPIHSISARYLTWTLGRRVVVLERRGTTWRMVARAA